MRFLARIRGFVAGVAAGFPLTVLVFVPTTDHSWPVYIMPTISGLALLLLPFCLWAHRRSARILGSIEHTASQRGWAKGHPDLVIFTETEVDQIGENNPELADAIRQLKENENAV